MGPAPVGHGVEVFGQRGITEDLGLLVLGVFGEWEGIVCGGAAEYEESSVAQILADFSIRR